MANATCIIRLILTSWVTICGLLEEIIECWRMIFTTWRKLGALKDYLVTELNELNAKVAYVIVGARVKL